MKVKIFVTKRIVVVLVFLLLPFIPANKSLAGVAQPQDQIRLNTDLPYCGNVSNESPAYYTRIEGKLGREKHLTETQPKHYVGNDSAPLNFEGSGAFPPHTTNGERWYITAQWMGWDWEPTEKMGYGPTLLENGVARTVRANLRNHKKFLIQSTETGKKIIVSAEESGPARWVTTRDGVRFGAPPEVYKYLGTSDPYTGNPNDSKGKIKVLGVVGANNTLTGPCQ